jgi:DNA-binding response OmpR family regulator
VARILIAEDDPLIYSFVEKGLRAAGYTTRVAEDGEQATELALAGGFDLMLLDMALPKREGIEVLQELRRNGKDIPVIVLTGRPEMRDVMSALDVGVHDFMTKPFRFDELLTRVRERLRFRGIDEVDALDAGARTGEQGELDPTARDGARSRVAVDVSGETGWRGS